VQGPLWGAAAEDWLDNERFTIPLYEAVFDAVELGPGVRLFDVGCGAGLALQMAAERGASVTGIDASEGLLEVARRRLPDADLRQGDLEDLPFPDDSYDVVTSFNAVQFAADPLVALSEAKRVAVPGGKVVIVTWGDPERCGTRHILAAAAPLLPPAPPGAAGPFALSAPGKLEELASTAGLTPERAADVDAPFTFASLDEAVRIQMSAGPLQRAAEHSGEAATRQALAEAFVATARQDDGSYRHDNVFRYLITAA
jgi:SAM-dependent methyltransferase